MAPIKSAAELDVSREEQTKVWQGIKTTALSQVEQFCTRNGLEPGQFMANMGWLRQGQWTTKVDWKECVEWNSFSSVIMENIAPSKRGLDMRGFSRTLGESQETYAQNAAPQKKERVYKLADEDRERAAATFAEEEPQAPKRKDQNPAMSAQTWAVAYTQTEDVLDKFPKLTEEQREAIHNIVDQAAPENRALVDMNLRAYVSYLWRDQKIMTEDQAEKLFRQVMTVTDGVEVAVRAERRPPTRTGELKTPHMQAPEREERYVYRLTVSDSKGKSKENPEGLLSTYEIVSPSPIESTQDMIAALERPEQGRQITRIGKSGKRIDIAGDEARLLHDRLAEIQENERYRITLAESRESGKRG